MTGTATHVEQCPTCPSRGVDGHHVRDCAERTAEVAQTVCHAKTLDRAPAEVAVRDLMAHLGTEFGAVDAGIAARLVLNLGWRPVVGS